MPPESKISCIIMARKLSLQTTHKSMSYFGTILMPGAAHQGDRDCASLQVGNRDNCLVLSLCKGGS